MCVNVYQPMVLCKVASPHPKKEKLMYKQENKHAWNTEKIKYESNNDIGAFL